MKQQGNCLEIGYGKVTKHHPPDHYIDHELMISDDFQYRECHEGFSPDASSLSESNHIAACSSLVSVKPNGNNLIKKHVDYISLLLIQLPVDCNSHAISPAADSCNAQLSRASHKSVPLSLLTYFVCNNMSSSSCISNLLFEIE